MHKGTLPTLPSLKVTFLSIHNAAAAERPGCEEEFPPPVNIMIILGD